MLNTIEVYKQIPEFENYQVSNLGNIRTLNYKRTNQTKVLVQNYNHSGYSIRSLYKDGVRKSFLVHRLVGLLFIPNTMDKPQINHKNGNRSDNRVENLEWHTQSENAQHSFRELGRKGSKPMLGKKGSAHHLSKKVDMYSLENEFIKTWSGVREIARHFKIAPGNISKCCNGKARTSAGFKWKFSI